MPKNYEIASTFVKVMQKKMWLCFFRTPCTLYKNRRKHTFVRFFWTWL